MDNQLRKSHEEPTPTEPDRSRSLSDYKHPKYRSFRSHLTRLCFKSKGAILRLTTRILEMGVGIIVCILAVAPIFLWFLGRKQLMNKIIFTKKIIVGENGRIITIHPFNTTSRFLKDLPLFFDLLTGRVALVGTAISDFESLKPASKEGYIRMIKPGIFSLWKIRERSGIAHGGKIAVEWEYVFRKDLFYDLFLILRSIPTMLYGGSSDSITPVLKILNLSIDNLSMEEAVSVLEKAIDCGNQSQICFVNPDCMNKMVKDQAYFKVLQDSTHLFPDGIGLTLACNLLKTPLRENINGTDMLPYLCRMAKSCGYSLFLLGGSPGVAQKAAKRLQETYDVKIAGTAHGYFEGGSEEEGVVIKRINASGAHILLVALGAPAQEMWIATHKIQLAPTILMGVGGLFDFYSGNIKRAPIWMRELGLEWAFRISQEPGRMWRRYMIGNPLFIYRIMKWKHSEKLSQYHENDTR